MRKNLFFKDVKELTIGAMLVAMSVVMGIFCKTVLNFGGGLFRVTFENLPIIISGLLFGPIIGGLTGLTADLISYLLSGQVYPLNLIVTLGSVTVGTLSGVVSRFIIRKRSPLQVIASGGLAHVVFSMIIKPIGLFAFYEWAVLWRIPLYLVIAPLEILLICLLFKNNGIKRLLDGIDKENK